MFLLIDHLSKSIPSALLTQIIKSYTVVRLCVRCIKSQFLAYFTVITIKNKMDSIGVLTSGGDSPGMNAAIRAVVRTAVYHKIKVFGIRRGYQGLIDGDIVELKATDVSNIIQRGGTILKTARSKEFLTPEGMETAYNQVQKHGIKGLVLIGGDGTFRGADEFFKQYDIPAVGIPGTIDKDLGGTDFTIGYDTALNTAVEAIDKIRDTAEAHDRLFIIEVMGRDAGHLALNSGIACGAEDILIPETTTDVEAMLCRIALDERRKKTVHIIVVAEGDDAGGALGIHQKIQDRFPNLDTRTCVLGHIQRGGTPSGADRVLASRLGHSAVEALVDGRRQVMVGLMNAEITFTPFGHAIKQHTPINPDLLDMIHVLAV